MKVTLVINTTAQKRPPFPIWFAWLEIIKLLSIIFLFFWGGEGKGGEAKFARK